MSTSDQSPHGAATSEAMQTVLSELISHQNECRRITKRLHLLLKLGSDSDDDRILTTADASSLTPAHAPPSPWPCVSDQDVNKCRRITKRLHLLGLDKPPRTPHTLPEEASYSCDQGKAQPSTHPTVVHVSPSRNLHLLSRAAAEIQHSRRAATTDNTELKVKVKDEGAPDTDVPMCRTKSIKNRTKNGWNGCNLFKNYTKYCSTTRGEPLHLSEYVRLHLSTARSYRRRHSPTMCTVSCKPPELDLLKGEGSNLQKTGVHLMTQWKHHLTQKDRELYNTAARLITRTDPVCN